MITIIHPTQDKGNAPVQRDYTEFLRSVPDHAINEPLTNVNSFPVDAFPAAIQQIVKETNTCLSFPADFSGAAILFAASLAIGNSYRVQVKNEWTENAVLYQALVGLPGTNKTHPLVFFLRPFFSCDEKTYNDYTQRKREYDQIKALPKKEQDDELIKPTWKKYLVSDFTLESLALTHSYNERGIGVYVDELAAWYKNFSRYHAGSDTEFWLSNWSGTRVNVDRKTSDSIYIARPFIPVIGCIQPGVLNELSAHNRNQNGFTDRILFAFPAGLKKEYWKDAEVSPDISNEWTKIIDNLLTRPYSQDEQTQILHFTSDARSLLKQWQQTNTDKINKEVDEQIAGIYNKLEVYVVRLALIIQLLLWASDEDSRQAISREAVNGAIKLTEYFRGTAVRVYGNIIATGPGFTTGQKKLVEMLPDQFTTAQAMEIAAGIGIPERTAKEYLSRQELFEHLSHGNYKKIV